VGAYVITRVGVVVPAHNEEELVTECVLSVLAAVDAVPFADVCVVVVADSCTDRTAVVAALALDGRGHVLEIDERRVGAARAAGSAIVLEHFAGVDPTDVWLANTDADSTVPVTWLRDQLALADQGVAAVAGVVTVASFFEHPRWLPDRFHAFYQADYAADYHAADAHPHVHGANFGVRADAYLDVGGWPTMREHEDNVLWATLRLAGWSTRSTRAIDVITSGRRSGRAGGGFAGFLREMGELPA
jgi:glycosyltransferase involved in cell wall biosynthesis